TSTVPSTVALDTRPLHDALPIYLRSLEVGEDADAAPGLLGDGADRLVDVLVGGVVSVAALHPCYLHSGVDEDVYQAIRAISQERSEEHTSELQSRENVVCCLLLG